MIKVVAPTLEEAYKKASQALDCSIVDIDIKILQAPSKGVFGLFKKEAIINISHKNKKSTIKEKTFIRRAGITDENKIREEIEEGMKRLIENSCFDAYIKSVNIDQDNGVTIELDGPDAALMIGKEGYRYKALSYMVHNWIKIKYNLSSTLEIAAFLQTQKEAIEKYLDLFSERIKESGRVQTKPLDGILVKLALDGLRQRYPDKYVAIRTLKNGKKVIIVNEYTKKGI